MMYLCFLLSKVGIQMVFFSCSYTMDKDQTELDLKQMLPLLKIKKQSGKDYVWDPTRGKFLLMQPEEFIRQLLIQYLFGIHGIPLGRMKTEQSIRLFDTSKRCDLIVYNKLGKPYLLAECKSFEKMDFVPASQQIQRYNMQVDVDKLLITNGPMSFFFVRDQKDTPFKLRKTVDLSDFS